MTTILFTHAKCKINEKLKIPNWHNVCGNKSKTYMKKQLMFTVTIALCAVLISIGVGCKKSSQNNSPVLPPLDFTISGSNYLGGTVFFKCNQGNTFEWDLGESTFSNEAAPFHNYAKIGIYNVKLRINGKQEDTLAKIVAIGQDSLMMARIGNRTLNWHHSQNYHSIFGDTTYVYNDTSIKVSLVDPMTLAFGSAKIYYESSDGTNVNFAFFDHASYYYQLIYTNSTDNYSFTYYRHTSASSYFYEHLESY